MSDQETFPPPGQQPEPPHNPPPGPPPGTSQAPGAPSAPGWSPGNASGWTSGSPAAQPDILGAAHKPGAVPLRPLGLSDMYDAAFRIIRFNPKATVGSAVLVASVTMLIPVAISAIITFTVGTALSDSGEIDFSVSNSETVGTVASFGSFFGAAILLQIGLIFVTGMIAHVTRAAALGKRLSLGEAWSATRGKRWKLLGLIAVINGIWTLAIALYVGLWILVVAVSGPVWPVVVWGIITVPLFVVASVWFWVRLYYLPAPILMLEPVGVFGAITRGFRLTRGQFWRIFGIALLTVVITTVAGAILSGPISVVGQLASIAVPEYAVLGLAVTQAVSSVISAAFVAPFTSAVTSLQYIDQRMRKEAYDVELMTHAGITAP